MTLFFNPSPGTDWAGPPLSSTEGLRSARSSLSVVGVQAPARVAGVAQTRSWRADFPAFRAWTLVRDVTLSAAAGASLLLTAPSAPLWALAPAVAVPSAIAAAGGYRWRTLGEGASDSRAVLRAGVLAVFVLVLVGFLGLAPVPTALATVATPVAVGATLVAHRIAARRIAVRRRHGQAGYRTLVLGSAHAATELVSELERAPSAGYRVVAWCPTDEREPVVPGVPRLGALTRADDVAGLVVAHEVDVVLLAGEHDATTARRVSWALEGTGASLVVLPMVSDVGSGRVRVRPTGDLWSVQLDVAPRPRRVPGKGVVDRVLGAALLAVAGLILVPVLVAVRLTSPGKALYKQQRIGRHGRPFTMWKVRSMYVDADARRAALLARQGAEGNELLFKMKDDPRVTPIGRVLRRLSIDELPQLVNVVRGDMSIVGPRPALAEETSRYVGDEPRRLAVKPGLTGLWQVSGRSNLTREESMRLDLRYVDNVSLGLDAAILGRTFRAVFRGLGAY